MHELKLMDIEKRYKDKEAVRKFNYTFVNGVYGLLGENGAGKTTLMEQSIESYWDIYRRILDIMMNLLLNDFFDIWLH